MSQTDFAGRRLTISDLGRASTRQTAAAPATPRPAIPARSTTPAPSSKPAKAKVVKQKRAKSLELLAKAAANIERDRQQHYEAVVRRAAARDTTLVQLRARFSVVFDPDRPLPLAPCPPPAARRARCATLAGHRPARVVDRTARLHRRDRRRWRAAEPRRKRSGRDQRRAPRACGKAAEGVGVTVPGAALMAGAPGS